MWLKNKYLSYLAMAGLVIGVVGCDSKGGEVDSGSNDAEVSDEPIPGGVNKSANETAEANFAAGTEEFLVVPYSTAKAAADAIDFKLSIEAPASNPADVMGSIQRVFKLTAPTPSLRERNPAFWQIMQNQLKVEAWTHGQGLALAKKDLRPSGAELALLIAGSCLRSSECGATEVCHNGSCESQVQIKVKEFSATDTIQANVKRKGKNGAILVDSAETVSESDLDDLMAAFDDVIYPRDVALFGNPLLKSGSTQLSSDRNGDGLVWLVVTSKVAEKNNAIGFFVRNDFDPNSATSNKLDALFITAPKVDKNVTLIKTIVAHEFQHLLNFSTKVYRPQQNSSTGTAEELWLDEGLAHFAQDACGFPGFNVTLLSNEAFPTFGDKSLIASEDTNEARGMALTFVWYLFQRKGGLSYGSNGAINDGGGATWLHQLLGQNKTGAAGVEATFGSFSKAVQDWLATLAIDGRGISTTKYRYGAQISDPKTSAKVGLVVRGTAEGVDGKDDTLTGPREEAVTATTDGAIPNATGYFYLLKGFKGKVKVAVQTQESNFGFLLIKVK